MQNEIPPSWEYHMNYRDIADLYGDLCRVVSDICLEDSQIVLHYHSDTMVVKFCNGGCSVAYNNKKCGVWEDQDIYYEVLGFMHEQVKNREANLWDSAIIRMDETGIQYRDEMGRIHALDCSDLIEVKEPEPGKHTGSVLFRTAGAPVRFDFTEWFVHGKRKHAFTGGRRKRWDLMKQTLETYQSRTDAERNLPK